MSREQQIEAGKIWQVYLAGDDRHEPAVLFEGSKIGAFGYVAQNFGLKEWKRGNVRISKLIWETA